MFAGLLLKLPILKQIGGFLTSGKFLAFIAAIVIALFVFTQGVSFVGKYVDREVSQQVDLNLSKQEVEQLKHQVKTLKNNQQIVNTVVKETRVLQDQQVKKAEKIEEQINEKIKDGNDGFTADITSGVIDSL